MKRVRLQAGSRECWTAGLLACWPVGLLACWPAFRLRMALRVHLIAVTALVNVHRQGMFVARAMGDVTVRTGDRPRLEAAAHRQGLRPVESTRQAIGPEF